jgi:GT2 family glycosyltransferase
MTGKMGSDILSQKFHRVLDKVGIGIVTCNRQSFFERLIASLPVIDSHHYVCAVNDGLEYFKQLDGQLNYSNVLNKYHQNHTNLGVGKSKNILFKTLLDAGCDHIFIIEDDMVIKDLSVFERYIEASKVTGLKHMMFGYHGPANKNGNQLLPRFIVPYNSKLNIAFNTESVGSFCYYRREVLLDIGLNDENFTNAWEHVEHSYRIVKAGYIPGYWYWPDLANSCEYIGEQACSEDNSTIRPRDDWKSNIVKGAKHFMDVHGYLPVSVPDIGKELVYKHIKDIKNIHGEKL